MKLISPLAMILALMLAAALPMEAQTDGTRLCTGKDAVVFNSFERALRSNLWQDASNPAGIRQDSSVTKISYAEAFGAMESGGLRQSYEASMPWCAGARARTLVHLQRFSMQGSFSFEQTRGEDMCGSMFVNPGQYPIDALEFTPGRKEKQTYAFDGSISIDLCRNLRVGAGMDFTSANLAKRKDLRHSNYLLDMTLTPGLLWHSGDFAAGANFIFRKTADTPTARQVGSKDTYEAFLDKGLRYGKLENWEGSGLHIKEAGVSGLPLREIFTGAGVQLQWRGFFAAMEYLHGQGSAGEKQYIWYKFPSNNLSLHFGARIKDYGYVHSLRADVVFGELCNYESIIEKVTEGGVSTTVTHGSNLILSRHTMLFKAEYSIVSPSGGEFVMRYEANTRNSVASQMYPYVTSQHLLQYCTSLGYTHFFGPLQLAGGVSCFCGDLYERDRLVSSVSGVESTLFRLEDYYMMDVEYGTIPRISAGLSLTYDFWKGSYVKVAADYVRAFGAEALMGNDRLFGKIGIGYEF